ncbi:MAG: hypothetical protein GY847_28395 [Proteobacteria bacterium]|nr:hypothetical protein [Pseudomonadota bacterium]
MKEIQRDEIIGQRVERLFYTYELIDGGLDCTTVYFVLKNGVVFVPPMPGHPWVREKLPWRRKQFDVENDPIVGHTIVGVYGEKDEDGPDAESCLFRLDDARWIYVCMCAPHGTGATGLRVADPELVDESKQIDLWELGTPHR